MRALFLFPLLIALGLNSHAAPPPAAMTHGAITLTLTIPPRHYIAAIGRHLNVPADSVAVIVKKISPTLHYKIVSAQ